MPFWLPTKRVTPDPTPTDKRLYGHVHLQEPHKLERDPHVQASLQKRGLRSKPDHRRGYPRLVRQRSPLLKQLPGATPEGMSQPLPDEEAHVVSLDSRLKRCHHR